MPGALLFFKFFKDCLISSLVVFSVLISLFAVLSWTFAAFSGSVQLSTSEKCSFHRPFISSSLLRSIPSMFLIMLHPLLYFPLIFFIVWYSAPYSPLFAACSATSISLFIFSLLSLLHIFFISLSFSLHCLFYFSVILILLVLFIFSLYFPSILHC